MHWIGELNLVAVTHIIYERGAGEARVGQEAERSLGRQRVTVCYEPLGIREPRVTLEFKRPFRSGLY